MPRIPIYQEEVPMEPAITPAANLQAPNMGINALVTAKNMEMLGKAGQTLADIGVDLNRKIYHAKQVDALADAQLNSTQQLYQLRDEVKKNPDPDTWQKTFDEGAQQIFQNIYDGLPDMQVQAAYKGHWAHSFPVISHAVQADARKQSIANFAGNLEANYAKSLDLYEQAQNDLERARIKADTFGMLQGGVAAGYLAPAKAEELKQKFDSTVQLNAINAAILQDPASAIATLEKPGGFGLNDTQRMQMIPHAHAQLNRVQSDNYLKNMQTLEQGNLTIDDIRQQRNNQALSVPMAERLEAYVQGQQTQFDQSAEAEVWTRHREAILNGTDTEAAILADVKSGHLKWTTADKLIGQLEAVKKNQTKPDDWWFKTSLQMGKAMLGGQIDPTTNQPEETPAYYNFAFALKQKIEQDHLTGADIQKAAQELIAPLAAQKANKFMFGPASSAPPQPGIISRAWNAVTGSSREYYLYKNGQKVPVDKATYDAYVAKYGRGPE